ncbi:hypothetical protein H8356DRAFT_1671825 [Neocallimastix lanati (nom. inval.)]|jgi:hypothetical protein|nr:hypothetical protein H8356DRAFT_1671825 [Neocallimastix sp. JGI-2020a]
MEKVTYFSYIVILTIIFLISNVVCIDLPICKTCIVTGKDSGNPNVKFGWEEEHSCIIDSTKCKDYMNLEYCIGYTVDFEYMGSAYGKENNKTCIVDPIYKNYNICKRCFLVYEEARYTWGKEDNKICLLDLYKCRPQAGSNERTYPYYVIFIDFGFVFLISWAITKII